MIKNFKNCIANKINEVFKKQDEEKKYISGFVRCPYCGDYMPPYIATCRNCGSPINRY